MLQVNKKVINKIISASLITVLSAGVAVNGSYLNTNRDTRKAPERSKSAMSVSSAFEKIYESDKVAYYYREDRDIFAIEDKATGYVWKTGLDVPFKKQVEDAKDAVNGEGHYTVERLAEKWKMTKVQVREIANTPIEESMNEQYTGIANSLISIECFKGSGESMTTTTYASASYDDKDGDSSLEEVSGSNGKQWKLNAVFDKAEIGVEVMITLGDDGSINYNIPYDGISGKGIKKLSSISITPFLGASGGVQTVYNEKEKDWTDLQKKYLTPGYVFVPDGSGSLIRFAENTSKFSDYTGDVYGSDLSSYMYYYSALDDSVPLEDPVMPVFGVSQGDGTQSAFVAYADSGDEFMTIIATPSSTDKNKIRYTYAYPKFSYNTEFYQVTNQAGDAYRKTQDKANEFDIDMTYDFLYGDGSNGELAADYTGMAKAYREHLIEEGILTVKEDEEGDIPMRIDFLMSDSKKGVFGTQEVAVTTTDDVKKILDKLIGDGITNINSGLMGWQKNGETLAKPSDWKFSKDIGKKGKFKDLMKEFSDKEIDISFSRDFVSINSKMINYYGNAAKHLNTQYLTVDKSKVLPENSPVTDFSFALPTKSANWLTSLYERISDYNNSITVKGISNTLLSSHSSTGPTTTVTQAINLYEKAFEKIKKNGATVNMDSPNQYLWKYTDRYLQSPVGTSQYVYETDTVPFLQMVLNGTMEVYAPYANFSFYSTTDQLRMIDYNICPSFVLTQEPSYLLASTTSSDYYSTEFEQYEQLVKDIYNKVNTPLSKVVGYKWSGRKVVSDGVIVNTYKKDGDTKSIVINYTKDKVTVGNTEVAAQSAEVIEGGVK